MVNIPTKAENGYSKALIQYKFSFPTINGKHYFRIKQEDIDGKVTYSKVLISENNNNSNVVIYPNPSNDKIIYINGLVNNINNITVVSALGQQYNVKAISNNDTHQLNLQSLPAGVYSLFINNTVYKIVLID